MFWQLVLNLTWESESQHNLVRKAISIEQVQASQAEAGEKKDPCLPAQIDLFKILSAFWFADYRKVLEIAKQNGFDKDGYAKIILACRTTFRFPLQWPCLLL